MSKQIVFIRHAESSWNSKGVTEPDVEITENGREQASLLEGNYDLVICSTLKRARQTLDNSNIKYSKVMFTELCREIMDGNIVNHYNGEKVISESEKSLYRRIDKLMELIANKLEKFDRIAIITHYCFLEKVTGFQFKNGYFMKYSEFNHIKWNYDKQK